MTSPEAFSAKYPFPLDPFQLDAIDALDQGGSVLVAAPTGSGKTVVAEYGIELALDAGRKAFYTTPLKALSNQKFGDFVSQYGAHRVGLLTGDNSINSEAEVVVMTTEVLRNMLYERSPTLERLSWVVLDEVHYLQDPYRGAVWEEVLIHLPPSAGVVCLSATISNAEEFGEWIGTLRGKTRVVIEEKRPVPLRHHYLVGLDLHPMHVEEDGILIPNPYLASLEQRELRVRRHRRRSDGRTQQSSRGRPREGHRRTYRPRREDVVRVLERARMLPAIYFVFSRAGCAQSVEYLLEAGVRLTSVDEEKRIREVAETRSAWMPEEDLAALGFADFLDGLGAGIAAHHAGMLPVFKEIVEELFAEGLVKVVFATETLSLGINMPARTVVIEDLWKFQGERHELLTPGEYTQLTGRAGRRGIDEVGNAVVLYQRDVDFERVAALATTRTYELRSSFRPSYNMSVNLVRNYTHEQAHHLLNSSFGQFLADRGVVELERQLRDYTAELSAAREKMKCRLGDFDAYWVLSERANTARERARGAGRGANTGEIKKAISALRPGDVVYVPSAKRRGLAAVVDSKATAVSEDRKQRPFRLLPGDFREAPEPIGGIRLPRTGRPQSPKYRRDVAESLSAVQKPPRTGREKRDPRAAHEAKKIEEELARHPSYSCPDRKEHEEWARRAAQLEKAIADVEKRIRSRTETLGKRLERVLEILEELDYVEEFSLTAKGEMLARIYGESDLLIAEALSEGMLADLDAQEVASLASALVYEQRDRVVRSKDMPTQRLEERFRALTRLWGRIRREEDSRGLELCREPDGGFAKPLYHWSGGESLEKVLAEAQTPPGDFVRTCKQVADVLRQIEDAAPDAAIAHSARHSVNRGIVAYTGLEQ
ncbi:MAG: DEAD/DEAH box helicase [Actinomycetota bacterium]